MESQRPSACTPPNDGSSISLPEQLKRVTAQSEDLRAENEELRLQCERLVDQVQSAEQWQTSWIRRVFFRWHASRGERRTGFFQRLRRSFRKRLGRQEVSAPEPSSTGLSRLTLPAPIPQEQPVEAPVLDERQIERDLIRLRYKAALRDFLNGTEHLQIACSERPKISILIVLFNNAEFTYSCVRALEAETELPLEVIVVDNGSRDETGRLLERIRGVERVRNPENRGFLKAVNQAAAQARGEFLLLLNNDAIPRPGSLGRALETIVQSEDIAAVGARLVRPDGSLQEAGSIVWSDGKCRGYARGRPEGSFEAMFRRDVDYCSAAFLLLRRALFASCGGFDESFAPAYFEESDLAMTFHEKGFRVVYEPFAVVDHFECASSENPSLTEAQLRKNQRVFQAKHRASLENHQTDSPRNTLWARSRDNPAGRILFLESHLPFLTNGSGCPRALEMLLAMHREGFFVTFWPLGDPFHDWDAAYQVVPREVELVLGRNPKRLPEFLKEREGFYSVLLVSRPKNMELIQKIKESSPDLFVNLKIIYDAEAVYAARRIKMAEVLGAPLTKDAAESLVEKEINLASDVDGIAVTSWKQREYFQRAGCRNVKILSHCVRRRPGRSGFSGRWGFLFVGRLLENHSPNADSLLWFALKVLPLLRQHLGEEIPVNIVGANEGLILKRFGDSSFRFLGPRENVDELYESARVFVAPTRFASGIPLKILEAAAYGVPVVTTGFLADLLDWSPGEHLLASDDPCGFAELCVRLHSEEDLWKKIRKNALIKMDAEHSPDAFGKDLIKML